MPDHTPTTATTTQGRTKFGGMGQVYGPPEFGTISAVAPNTYTYSVRTMSGRALPGVPRKRMSPSDLALLPVGTTVIVRYDIGMPYIDGVLDQPATLSTTPGIPATESAPPLNPADTYDLGNHRAPHEPNDLLGGDHLLGNMSGVRVGALAGGVALLRASGGAQIRAHALNDLIEMVSRNYRHITDMGFFEVKNDGGRVSMKFRGASDQTNEAGADEEHWTIRMDLGAAGDLFNFELTTPQGATLFKLHVDSNGRCELFGLDGVIIQSGAQNGEEAVSEAGGDTRDTVQGNRTETTKGSSTEEVSGDLTSSVDGVRSVTTSSDVVTVTGRDLGVTVARNVSAVVGGDPTSPTTPAVRAEVRGGDVELSLGQPTTPNPGIKINTQKGGLKFDSRLGGNVELTSSLGTMKGTFRKVIINTAAPDSVIIGGSTLASHLAKFEELEQMLGVLLRLLDSHVHPHPTAPTGPVVVPFSSTIKPLIARIKSLRAGVGG